MDSNITRAARKNKVLSQTQFIRELNKQKHIQLKPGKVDKSPLFYLMLLAQAAFDIKELTNENNIKYPIAIMFFSVYKLYMYLGKEFAINPMKPVSANYYIALNTIEKEASKAISYFNWLLFDLIDGHQVGKLKASLKEILYALVQICVALDIPVNKMLYLACEFFKEISPSIHGDDCERVATKVTTIRELYLSRIDMKKMGVIDKALKAKFEELI